MSSLLANSQGLCLLSRDGHLFFGAWCWSERPRGMGFVSCSLMISTQSFICFVDLNAWLGYSLDCYFFCSFIHGLFWGMIPRFTSQGSLVCSVHVCLLCCTIAGLFLFLALQSLTEVLINNKIQSTRPAHFLFLGVWLDAFDVVFSFHAIIIINILIYANILFPPFYSESVPRRMLWCGMVILSYSISRFF